MSRDVDMGGPLEGNFYVLERFWGMNDSVIYLTPMKKKLTEEVIVFLLCE